MNNVQINGIQQMVIEGDQDDKSKHMFNNIHGLLEAKVVLKHLYSTGVQSMLESKLKQEKFENDIYGTAQELKEANKKREALEEEFKLYKKENNTEMNNLIKHYEQRILILLKSGIQSADCDNDERISLIMEQLKSLEKKSLKTERRSIKQEAGILGHPHSTEYGVKRAQRLKRDHRRTRVIRTEDVEPIKNRMNAMSEEIEQSPSASPSAPNDQVPPTPDDKDKDPDWINPWIRTPLAAKARNNNFGTYIKKDNTRKMSKKSSRTRLLPTTLEHAMNLSSNDENLPQAVE